MVLHLKWKTNALSFVNAFYCNGLIYLKDCVIHRRTHIQEYEKNGKRDDITLLQIWRSASISKHDKKGESFQFGSTHVE